jgi:predicted TPR repeat methyltransferase
VSKKTKKSGGARSRVQSAKKRRAAAKPKGAEARVTIEHALGLATQIHQSGLRLKNEQALEEARVLYERILAAVPEHPEALHFLGVLCHQRGDRARAVELIERSIAAAPTSADFHNNLGNVLKEQERLVEAADAYRRAIELAPGHADAQSNLGTVLKAQGKVEEAIEAYERVIELMPEHVGAHHNLGNALQRVGRREEAIAHYRQAVALDPDHPDARKLLALALFYSGHVKEAITIVEQWAKLDPDNPVASHMLAAFSGSNVPERASDAYVERAFDAMSATFDEHLRDLGYRAPELVLSAVAAHLGEPSRALDVLDAGCGTGLCGPLLRPYARRLVGVDLSSGMLQRAEGTGAYDALEKGELTAFLQGAAPSDLIVSADTLCYFGDLAAVTKAAAGALREGGHFVFTVEKNVKNDEGYLLNPHGRYSHTEAYLRATASEAGLSVASLATDTLRHERDEPVAGLLAVLRK